MTNGLLNIATIKVAIRNILVNRWYRLEPEPKLPIKITGADTEDSLARSPSYYALE